MMHWPLLKTYIISGDGGVIVACEHIKSRPRPLIDSMRVIRVMSHTNERKSLRRNFGVTYTMPSNFIRL